MGRGRGVKRERWTRVIQYSLNRNFSASFSEIQNSFPGLVIKLVPTISNVYWPVVQLRWLASLLQFISSFKDQNTLSCYKILNSLHDLKKAEIKDQSSLKVNSNKYMDLVIMLNWNTTAKHHWQRYVFFIFLTDYFPIFAPLRDCYSLQK